VNQLFGLSIEFCQNKSSLRVRNTACDKNHEINDWDFRIKFFMIFFVRDLSDFSKVLVLVDKSTGRSRGMALVEFADHTSATKAFELDGREHMGRPLKISWKKQRNREFPRKNHRAGREKQQEKPEGCCTVFCGNLSFKIDNNSLADFFSECGSVLNSRVIVDQETGEPRG
jgi:nucleolin